MDLTCLTFGSSALWCDSATVWWQPLFPYCGVMVTGMDGDEDEKQLPWRTVTMVTGAGMLAVISAMVILIIWKLRRNSTIKYSPLLQASDTRES